MCLTKFLGTSIALQLRRSSWFVFVALMSSQKRSRGKPNLETSCWTWGFNEDLNWISNSRLKVCRANLDTLSVVLLIILRIISISVFRYSTPLTYSDATKLLFYEKTEAQFEKIRTRLEMHTLRWEMKKEQRQYEFLFTLYPQAYILLANTFWWVVVNKNQHSLLYFQK